MTYVTASAIYMTGWYIQPILHVLWSIVAVMASSSISSVLGDDGLISVYSPFRFALSLALMTGEISRT